MRRPGGNNPWYGTDIDFQAKLNDRMGELSEHRGQVATRLYLDDSGRRVLAFHHVGVDIPGREQPVPITIEFHEMPTYDTYGLHASEYPRVFGDPGAVSPHRLPGDALCLWYPADPEDLRWSVDHGLVALLNLAINHLFFEDYWRSTGGFGTHGKKEGIWLGDEAPHGFPDEWSAAL